ncbi:hypothetical protein MKW94_019212, partial [Papaver nudicaule]|nr:hypothetical protein [Papaver nudicaule]
MLRVSPLPEKTILSVSVETTFPSCSAIAETPESRATWQDFIEYRRAKEFRQKYQKKVDRFFFIPEEVHILSGSSSIMVRNNSIIGIDTRITLNIRSRVGGLVR